ncbi:MAG: CBS domain-containing protein [Candidatus Dechloromonas phosphoritropha]|jgi:CBS domain-containing protein|nr:CBS domain-containing protein [Candidatus Dechloromonas phosphoritropha]MBP8786453.1 CBS domain-containing protein [Azonexus sp.]MBP9227001.1 CBS domain-containing protein [Azonexus sp.]
MTNRDLQLIIKDQDPVTLGSTATVQQACQRMWERRVGAVLVVDNGRLVGIFTGRDAVHTLADGRNPVDTTLSDVMTCNPNTIAPTAKAIDALRQMCDCGFRHLPIVDNEKVIGIVSRGDFKGLELDRLEEEIGFWERIC